MFNDLSKMLSEITGFSGISLQPNAGAQGEYAGLMVIRKYHLSRGEKNRNICLIPSSAHGTNPASAQMAGMKVVVINCDKDGNVDFEDLKKKVLARLPWGLMGFSICYDVRFPNLYRELAKKGAIFMTVPSAFTKTTGEKHWHTLLKARAIENFSYIFAAAQTGKHYNNRLTYGHSLIYLFKKEG